MTRKAFGWTVGTLAVPALAASSGALAQSASITTFSVDSVPNSPYW